MRRAALGLAACLLVGCPANEIVDGHVETRDASVPPAADFTFAAMEVDPSGRWIASPSASKGLHRLSLLDMTTRTFRSFDAARGARSVAFWDPSRGAGLDALTITNIGTQRTTSLVSLSLADGRTVLKKELGPGNEEKLSVVRSNDVLFVVSTTTVTAYDGATGAVRGAFSARPGTLLSVTPVPAARRVVVTTTRGAAILREEDASIACVAAPVIDDSQRYERKVRTAVIGTRAFLGIPVAAASHHAVVDVEACAYEGAVQGGPYPFAAKGAIASILDRYAGSPDAPPLPEVVTKSPARYHLVITDAGTLAQSYVPLDDTVSGLVVTPNGERLVTIDAAGVRIVDFATRAVRPVVIAKPSYLAASADSRHVFLGVNGKAMVLELETGTTTPIELPTTIAMRAVAPAGFDGIVVEQEAGVITLLDRASGARVDLPRPTVSP